MNTNIVHISLGERSYNIDVGAHRIGALSLSTELPAAVCAVIITNTHVDALYGDAVAASISSQYKKVLKFALPDGEVFKDWSHLQAIFDFLLKNQCDRNTVLFAVGGGVVGDMTGFAAASYMRGVPFVQIPTTLLAQVDSSVGGKTGINHPLGKNMIGAFYQPRLVVCDLDVLKTLEPRQMSAGLAEVIKYGPIFDMNFFQWLEIAIESLLAFDSESLLFAVRRSCEIKAEVVGFDERESGMRAILNFGHTFGHAIEAGMGYGKWLHGEAVGCGMLMAARLSERLGMVDADFVQRLRQILKRAHLPVQAPVLDANDNAGRYLELMQLDKKSAAGEIRFVLIDGPGKAVMRTAPNKVVREVIDEACAAD